MHETPTYNPMPLIENYSKASNIKTKSIYRITKLINFPKYDDNSNMQNKMTN